jgi:hypothetical protein
MKDQDTDIVLPDEEKNYFDKRDPEEESVCVVDLETQQKYEKIEEIYKNIVGEDKIEDAKTKSMSERVRLGIKDNDSYVYGEMTFRSLAYIFEVIKKQFGDNSVNPGYFYDLGSVIFIKLNF